ncbi:MAG TPA: alpha/beta fold hydrolase [Bryobacteraceae bacterium]|nr:alpha/beta fold hydrolase [Bryobacteraceae bacterium]
MKTKIAVTVSILLAVVVILAALAWYWMGQPMYRPGRLHLSASLQPPPQPAGGNYWTVAENIRLYHYADGDGANVLVVHGGPGFPIHRPAPGLHALAGAYRFHYYDQRGCGKSSRPFDRFASSNFYEDSQALDAALGLGAQVADIERIRRILHEDKLVLLGHSFGGFLAAMYAAEFPQHVKALVLVAPADVLVMPQKGGGLFGQVRTSLPAGEQGAYDAFLKHYLNFRNVFNMSEAELAAMNTEFARYYGAAAAARGIPLPAAADTQDAGGWMVEAMYLSMGRWHDYRDPLRRVTAPVLIVHGARDLQTEAESRAYAQCFPHARFVVLHDAGHFPFTEQPEEFAAAAGQFLRELEQANI